MEKNCDVRVTDNLKLTVFPLSTKNAQRIFLNVSKVEVKSVFLCYSGIATKLQNTFENKCFLYKKKIFDLTIDYDKRISAVQILDFIMPST